MLGSDQKEDKETLKRVKNFLKDHKKNYARAIEYDVQEFLFGCQWHETKVCRPSLNVLISTYFKQSIFIAIGSDNFDKPQSLNMIHEFISMLNSFGKLKVTILEEILYQSRVEALLQSLAILKSEKKLEQPSINELVKKLEWKEEARPLETALWHEFDFFTRSTMDVIKIHANIFAPGTEGNFFTQTLSRFIYFFRLHHYLFRIDWQVRRGFNETKKLIAEYANYFRDLNRKKLNLKRLFPDQLELDVRKRKNLFENILGDIVYFKSYRYSSRTFEEFKYLHHWNKKTIEQLLNKEVPLNNCKG